jgi:hypothetical protein
MLVPVKWFKWGAYAEVDRFSCSVEGGETPPERGEITIRTHKASSSIACCFGFASFT